MLLELSRLRIADDFGVMDLMELLSLLLNERMDLINMLYTLQTEKIDFIHTLGDLQRKKKDLVDMVKELQESYEWLLLQKVDMMVPPKTNISLYRW